jgi:Tol biopolymer transport system component
VTIPRRLSPHHAIAQRPQHGLPTAGRAGWGCLMVITRHRAVAAIAALTAALATVLSNAGPAAATGYGRIAFNRGGDIYVANHDGTDAKRITFFNGSAGYPRWSPDGKTILFQARGSVWRIQPDGNGWAVLFPGERPAWSPDGKSVVYRDLIDYYETVRVRQLGTGATTEIDSYGDCGGGLADYTPGPSAAFLPGGRTVIYGTRTYSNNPRACGVRTSTDVTSRTVEQPRWGTITAWSAYAHFVDLDSAPTESLYVVATDAGAKDGLGRLYLGDRKGGHRWRITRDIGVFAPTFTPDGRSVYYSQITANGQWRVRRVSLGAPDHPRTILERGAEPTVEPVR